MPTDISQTQRCARSNLRASSRLAAGREGNSGGEIDEHPDYTLDHCTKSAVRFLPVAWDRDPREKAGEGWTPTRRVLLLELSNGPDFLRLKLVIGPASSNDPAATDFRKAVFVCSQKYRHDFPGGMATLYPRLTTVMSKELVKKERLLGAAAQCPGQGA
jgi:hypothetical protein